MHLVYDYARPREIVWRALTDPSLVPLWTSTGRGGRPEGFEPEVGTSFRLVGKPFPGWDGIVRCEVLEVTAPSHLRYSWRNKEHDDATIVTCTLEETGEGTRLTWDHTGFHGVGGAFLSLLLTRVRRTMLSRGLPAVLSDMDASGQLSAQSTLRPRET